MAWGRLREDWRFGGSGKSGRESQPVPVWEPTPSATLDNMTEDGQGSPVAQAILPQEDSKWW